MLHYKRETIVKETLSGQTMRAHLEDGKLAYIEIYGPNQLAAFSHKVQARDLPRLIRELLALAAWRPTVKALNGTEPDHDGSAGA